MPWHPALDDDSGGSPQAPIAKLPLRAIDGPDERRHPVWPLSGRTIPLRPAAFDRVRVIPGIRTDDARA